MYDGFFGAAIVLVAVIAAVVATYVRHMYVILKDCAKEDARLEADRMFDDYVHNCTYRIHQTMRIVDETGVKRK